MYRCFRAALLAIFSTLTLIGCATEEKSSKPEALWLSNMHRLSSTQQFLVSWSADNSKFSDPRNQSLIKNKLKEMQSASSELVADNNAPNADPLIRFFSVELAKEAGKSYSAFELNDLQMSRFAIARTSTYCIGCHTRSDRGVRNFPISWNNEISNLNSIQKIELLLANRHYESGYNLAMQLAVDEMTAKKDPRSWILVIEKALGMTVRVNNSPDQAEKLVNAVVNNQGAPFYIRRDAYDWSQDIQAWKNDLKKAKQGDRLNLVSNLIKQALNQNERGQSSLIKFLRASGLLHILLEDTKSMNYGKVLLFSGIVSGNLKELNMGYLDQFYYQSCIEHQPNSELAERCYIRLESSIRKSTPFLDVDPNANTEAISKLLDYRQMAEVKNEPSIPKWKKAIWEEEQEKKWNSLNDNK